MKRLAYIAALCLLSLSALAAPTYYTEITIDATKVDETIPVIPVFLSPGDTTFWTEVQNQNDLVFKNEAGDTTLPHYRVAFTDSGTTGTGCFLVNVSSIISTSVDAVIRLEFGDGAASDTSSGSSTFSSTNIVAFYLPGMTTTDITGGGANLTAVNTPGTAASDFEGVTAADYNGTDQYHYSNTNPVSDWPAAIECFAYADITTQIGRPFSLGESTGSPYSFLSFLYWQADGKIHTSSRGESATLVSAVSSASFSATTWYHNFGMRTSTGGDTYNYIDGGLDGSNTNAVASAALENLSIGALIVGSTTNYFDGRVAMAAVHDVERSANWISTAYKSWTDSGFLTWGSSTAISTSGNTDYEELTASATTQIVAGDSTWTNSDNFLTSLASAATSDVPAAGYSRQIELTNPSTNLDAVGSNTVTGIALEVIATGEDDGVGSGERLLYDESVQLIIGGSKVGDDKARAQTSEFQWTDTSQVTVIYGGEFDTWGLSEAQRAGTNFTASTFGVALRYYNDSGTNAALFSGYRVRVKLWWGGTANEGSFFFK